jgi:hypothetical protein
LHERLKPFERLQRHWNKNVQTRPAGAAAIAALEQKYGVRLPNDFGEYLLESCPLDANWDQEATYWWPVDRIRNIPDEYEYDIKNALVARDASKYLFFADYMIWCWAWAIACGDGEHRGRVAVINGVSDRFVADSFGQFVDRYILDKNSVA